MLVLVLIVAGGAVGAAATALTRRAFARRYAQDGQVEVVVRVARGGQPGLGPTWSHGLAKGSPGWLEFRPRGPGGLRTRSNDPLLVAVTHARMDPARRTTTLRTAWSVRPGMDIAVLGTPTGVLEVAAPDGSITGLLDALSAWSH